MNYFMWLIIRCHMPGYEMTFDDLLKVDVCMMKCQWVQHDIVLYIISLGVGTPSCMVKTNLSCSVITFCACVIVIKIISNE